MNSIFSKILLQQGVDPQKNWPGISRTWKLSSDLGSLRYHSKLMKVRYIEKRLLNNVILGKKEIPKLRCVEYNHIFSTR